MDTALQAIIKNNASLACHWARRGYIVNFTVTKVRNGRGVDEYFVTSDMVNGFPKDLAVQRALEDKVAA